MKIAALDLGSNTFLLLVAEVENKSIKKIFYDNTRVTRLGQGVHENRVFHVEALKRADECFKEFSEIIKQHQVDKVIAVSTSAARDVKNKDELIRIGQKHNIPIQIISGDKEAELTFYGSIESADEAKGTGIIDVGGGSTEIIGCDSTGAINGCSLDVGSVRLTEMFITDHPVKTSELEALRKYIREQLEKNKQKLPNVDQVIAVAGTPTTLTMVDQKVDFSVEKVHNYSLSVARIDKLLGELAELSLEKRKQLIGMEPKRADVIVAGAMILSEVAKHLGIDKVKVSVRGVRYGLAIQWEDFFN